MILERYPEESYHPVTSVEPAQEMSVHQFLEGNKVKVCGWNKFYYSSILLGNKTQEQLQNELDQQSQRNDKVLQEWKLWNLQHR